MDMDSLTKSFIPDEDNMRMIAGSLVYGIYRLHFKYKIAHLDIMPNNFLLHEDGHVVLTDFGISREAKTAHTLINSKLVDKDGKDFLPGTEGFFSWQQEETG